jgi:hypothetical protein
LITLFVVSVATAFACLVLASQLAEPWWRAALVGLAASAATALLSGVAAAAGPRLGRSFRAALALPGVAAAVSVATRGWLVEWLSPPEAVPRIEYLRIQLAALSAVGATFALLGGAAAFVRVTTWPHWVAAGCVMTAGLYSLGPLLVGAGVPVDHRAFLGLVGLGVGAWAVVEAARRVGAR